MVAALNLLGKCLVKTQAKIQHNFEAVAQFQLKLIYVKVSQLVPSVSRVFLGGIFNQIVL